MQGHQQALHILSLSKSQFTNPIVRRYFKLLETFELARMKRQASEMEAPLDISCALKFNSTSSISNSVSDDLGASPKFLFLPSMRRGWLLVVLFLYDLVE